MRGSEHTNELRAAPPQLPASSLTQERDRLAFKRYRTEREKLERRSVVRGLIVLAVFALVVSVINAGLDRVFVHGWWRP